MRFNILLSVYFLATLAAGLVIPSNDIQARNLDVREGPVSDAVDSTVFKREPRTSNAKKALIAAAKPAKAQAKAERKASFQEAAKAHRQTTNLPGRKSTFHVPAGGEDRPAQTYTGKDVRKAVFDGHMEAERIKSLSNTQARKAVRLFKNHPHQVPMAHGGGVRPLPHMRVDKTKTRSRPGREFDLPNLNKHKPGDRGPARVIVQKNDINGHYKFKGVVAHDQSRTDDTPGRGYNDHFQVKERRPK